MGNISTGFVRDNSQHEIVWNDPSQVNNENRMDTENSDVEPDRDRIEHRAQLESEFKLDFELKRETRRRIMDEKREKICQMSKEIEKYKEENENLRKIVATNNHTEIFHEISKCKDENKGLQEELNQMRVKIKDTEDKVLLNNELRINVAELQRELQTVNSELIAIEQERLQYANHITALKDIIRVTKDMLDIRENQIEDLKTKVKTVEELLGSREMKIMSDDLREEYERQLRNIRNLRILYEERQRIDKKDKENLESEVEKHKTLYENEQTKNSELRGRIVELENENSVKYDTITSLQSNLGLSKAECKELQAEIKTINQLFSVILLDFNNTQEIDLDNLMKTLEENHDLLTNIVANEESNLTAAALPKVLLDLVTQINNKENPKETENLEEAIDPQNSLHQLNSAAEIVENLPKVWKILIELLSHQNPPVNDLSTSQQSCYKSVETPSGPKTKLSVSQTYIRLKDLILEKKSLEKETYRLKHLNTHLESRLQDQETRLGLVSGEVSKTWNIVSKIQKQNQQLHTHEKILSYELAQKRKLLTQLKEELEYCREKWHLARVKNDLTQEQWKELRKEFTSRKSNTRSDFHQSVESGYSDDKSSSDDEKGYETDISEGKKEEDASIDIDVHIKIPNELNAIIENRIEGTDTNDSITTTSNEVIPSIFEGVETESVATSNYLYGEASNSQNTNPNLEDTIVNAEAEYKKDTDAILVDADVSAEGEHSMVNLKTEEIVQTDERQSISHNSQATAPVLQPSIFEEDDQIPPSVETPNILTDSNVNVQNSTPIMQDLIDVPICSDENAEIILIDNQPDATAEDEHSMVNLKTEEIVQTDERQSINQNCQGTASVLQSTIFEEGDLITPSVETANLLADNINVENSTPIMPDHVDVPICPNENTEIILNDNHPDAAAEDEHSMVNLKTEEIVQTDERQSINQNCQGTASVLQSTIFEEGDLITPSVETANLLADNINVENSTPIMPDHVDVPICPNENTEIILNDNHPDAAAEDEHSMVNLKTEEIVQTDERQSINQNCQGTAPVLQSTIFEECDQITASIETPNILADSNVNVQNSTPIMPDHVDVPICSNENTEMILNDNHPDAAAEDEHSMVNLKTEEIVQTDGRQSINHNCQGTAPVLQSTIFEECGQITASIETSNILADSKINVQNSTPIIQDYVDAPICSNENTETILNDTQPDATASGSNASCPPINAEKILSTREQRLQRLEEQCKQLVEKVTNTSQRSIAISNKLDDLHETYGESSNTPNEHVNNAENTDTDADSQVQKE